MKVIFSNLPSKMSAYEIRRLVSAAILPKGVLETAKSIVALHHRIKRLEFKIVTEVKSGQQCRYGIAIIEPNNAAERTISRLSNQLVRGHRISVREYNNRTYSNDRRNVNWREVNWQFTERRAGDRRVPTESFSTS